MQAHLRLQHTYTGPAWAAVHRLILSHVSGRSWAAVRRLAGLAGECERRIWWPFTQHAHLPLQRVGVVDARAGECYDMLLQNGPEPSPDRGQAPPNVPHSVNSGGVPSPDQPSPRAPNFANLAGAPSPAQISPNAPNFGADGSLALAAHYDGCASWWTQVRGVVYKV